MRLRQSVPTQDLCPYVVAIVLHGWAAYPPGYPEDRGFSDGLMDLYDGPDCVANMWRKHEAYLRDVAARWGWQPCHVSADGTRRFYGQALAAGFVG